MRSILRTLWLGLATGGVLLSTPAFADTAKTRSQSTFRDKTNRATQVAKEDVRESLLNAKVRIALLKGMTGADGLRVDITVRGTEVFLAGQVKDRASEKLAAEMARSVSGVTSVKSTIRLNPNALQQDNFEAEIQDSILASEVKMRLLEEVGDDAMNINVEAASGVVSLRGTMTNRAAANHLVDRVKDMHGVERVDDLIKTGR